MAVRLGVDQKSGVPIYVQLVEQIQHAVEVGRLNAGDRLPTVRKLARDLGIAPNTIVKAYGELQRAGLIESRPGVGTVIVESAGVAREGRLAALENRLRELVQDAAGLGMSEDDLWTIVDEEFERVRR